MERVAALLPRYVLLLRRYVLSDDEVEREMALIDATELAKSALAGGPAIDPMHELHRQAQSAVAAAWRTAPDGGPEQRGRERLVQGEALPLLLALIVPHELAQRAHHEQRWRREHETLVALFEQTDDMIVVLDPDGQCDDVNPAFCHRTGWTRREAVEGAAAWPAALLVPGTRQCRTEQPRRDGSRFTVEWTLSPILGRKGELLSRVCIGRDVDRQQKIDASLRENDKLRAVATLAGGIAHDFNNLLGSILGLAELCERDSPEGSRQARNLGRIRLAGDRAAELVRQMLDFSRQTPTTLRRVHLGEWLAQGRGLLRAALPRDLGLDITVLEDSPVRLDPVQMEQVLLNILRNAAQAMDQRGGSVRIVVDRAEPAGRPAAPGGPRHARVQIQDRGCGMAPDVLGKIFEPFFTTKPVGEGTGLGLAAVHGIVSSHDGVIDVASELGVGSTFSLYLPLAAA